MSPIINISLRLAVPLAALLLSACGGQRDPGTPLTSPIASTPAPAPAASYTIGGAVTGLVGNVVLQNNGGDNLTLSANGNFTFASAVANNSTYAVTVLTQPTGQTCSVSTGAGTVSGNNVSNVAVICSTSAYTVGGTVSGLTGTVVLQDNNGDDLTVSVNGTFTFVTPVAYGSPYSVTVLTQPTGQSCSIANGTGTIAAANVGNVAITCAANTYTVGGTVSGLSGSVVLQNNGGDNLTVSANGNFTFATSIADNGTYAVSILTQPTGQTCSVSTGAGTVSGNNVSNVAVTCSINAYTVGGAVGGLTGTVVLQDNNGDDLTVTANSTFTFVTPVAYGSPYSVTVLTQPTGQSCSIANGTGTIPAANVSNVTITCAANTYIVGGTVSGLSGSVVLQNNLGDNHTVSTNGPFTFPAAVTYGNPYSVTVLTQPNNQTCTVSGGSGTVTGIVSNVSVNCVMRAYNVTIVATGVSSGGSWVGNIWRASADNATVLASEIETRLSGGDVIINNWSSGDAPNGDITVSGAVNWSANTLTLSAARHVTINAPMTGAVGGTAKLVLEYGQTTLAANNHGIYRINTPVTLRSDPINPRGTATFSLKQGSDGATVGRPVPGCPVVGRYGLITYDCNFLSTAAEPVLDIKYRTVEVNGAADADIWVYVNQQSMFPGIYHPYVMTYQGTRGSVLFPNSEEQELHFDASGIITDLPNLNVLTTTTKIATTWERGPTYQLFSSSVFDHGYYLKTHPNAGESGNAYQVVSLLTVPLLTANTSYEVVDYVINVVPDVVPDAFSFTDQTGVARSTLTESNAITVTGITNTAAISVTGGEYQINLGAWTSAAGTVSKNDTVKVRHTSSAANLTMTNTVLTIGSGSDTFSTTTQ